MDDLFFGGALSAYCKLELSPKPPPLQDGAKLLGVCEKWARKNLFTGKLASVHCEIKIWTEKDISDERARRLDQLGTMIHEMIHAYLEIYSCPYKPCKERLSNAGKTGHGFAWQDAAFAIATATADISYLNLPIELGRCRGMVIELRASKETRNLDFKRWGMGHRDLALEHGTWVLKRED